jgi:hypothetical protein
VIDGVAAGSPVPLNDYGRAEFKTKSLAGGVHKIRADYHPGKKGSFLASSSPNLFHTQRNKGFPESRLGGGMSHGGTTHGGTAHGGTTHGGTTHGGRTRGSSRKA